MKWAFGTFISRKPGNFSAVNFFGLILLTQSVFLNGKFLEFCGIKGLS